MMLDQDIQAPQVPSARGGAGRGSRIRAGGWAFALTCGMLVASAGAAEAPAVVARPLLDTTTTWAGQPIEYPDGKARVVALEIRIAPGQQTGWHSHPVGSFAYVLEGELEVSARDGKTKRVKAGQALAEVVGLEHNGHNVGSGPVRLVVFYTAAEGNDALTRMAPDASP